MHINCTSLSNCPLQPTSQLAALWRKAVSAGPTALCKQVTSAAQNANFLWLSSTALTASTHELVTRDTNSTFWIDIYCTALPVYCGVTEEIFVSSPNNLKQMLVVVHERIMQ